MARGFTPPGRGWFDVNPPADGGYDSALLPAFAAAFHGAPAEGVAALGSPDAPGGGTDGRWLLGVCLGALGRYEPARRALEPFDGRPDSLCASTRASHLRQLGWHGEAEELDQVALRHADRSAHPCTARVDALVGLVADAVGRADPATARRRLEAAVEFVGALPETEYWRAYVRLAWVRAELFLLTGHPDAAYEAAGPAVARSVAASAPRHRAKSLLVLGVAAHLLGRTEAPRLLDAAARQAERLGLVPLVWPARLVGAQALEALDPQAGARARAAARAAVDTLAAALPPEQAARFLSGAGPASV